MGSPKSMCMVATTPATLIAHGQDPSHVIRVLRCLRELPTPDHIRLMGHLPWGGQRDLGMHSNLACPLQGPFRCLGAAVYTLKCLHWLDTSEGVAKLENIAWGMPPRPKRRSMLVLQ